jgi:hypothetical protein
LESSAYALALVESARGLNASPVFFTLKRFLATELKRSKYNKRNML